MNADSPDDTLNSNQHLAIQRIIESFERAWGEGKRPDWAEFLPVDPALRAAAARELVRRDWELRVQSGEIPSIEDYHSKVPTLRDQLTELFASTLHMPQPNDRDGQARVGKTIQGSDSRGSTTEGSSSGTGIRPGKALSFVPGMNFGDYEILEIIGRGGMGVVCKARHRTQGTLCALKTIAARSGVSGELVSRFKREARVAQRLTHPNIVAAIEAKDCDGIPYLALEFVTGSNLSDLVKRNGPLEVRRALELTIQAARGLAYAHEQGIIHRDVKPSNMLLDSESDTVKLLDLGLARAEAILDEATRSAELTSTGAMFGTVDFLAPEQARDAKRVDARADIYSLGCTLYYLLTGNMVYPGESMMQKLRMHRDAPVPRLKDARPEIPDALENAYCRMVAKVPDDRFPSMAAVIEALERVVEVLAGSRADEMPATIAFQSLSPKPEPIKRRLGWQVALAGTLLVAIIGGVVGLIALRKPPADTSATRLPAEIGTDDSASVQEATTTRDLDEDLPLATSPPVAWDWPKDFPGPALAPFTAAQARQHQEAWATKVGVPVVGSNAVEIPLALIPPGEFERGSPGDVFGLSGEHVVGSDQIDNSRPVRRIRLTRPFFIGIHEVTVGQFRRFVEATNYKTIAEQDAKGGWLPDALLTEVQRPENIWSQPQRSDLDTQEPVVFVTRVDAEAFCAWLSQQEQATYRLPTDAEWEFACRAGSELRFGVVDRETELEPFAWANEGRALPVQQRRTAPHPVGTKQANAFGLFDMLGNVWEVCGDGLDRDFYRLGPTVNPVAPSHGTSVMRGGSFFEKWPTSNPALRLGYARPTGHTGFRVVKELPVISELEPPLAAPLPVAGSPLGARAFVSSPTKIPGVISWSVETVGVRGGIAAIDYSPEAKLIVASSTTDPVLRFYDEKLDFQRVLVGPVSGVSSVAFSPDGLHVAATSWGSWESGLRVWEVKSGRLVHHDAAGQWTPPDISWSPDGRFLAYSPQNIPRVLELRTGISRSTFANAAQCMCWSPDGGRLAIRDNSAKIRIYAAPALNLLREVELAGGNRPMTWSPDGKWLAAVEATGEVRLFEGSTLEPVKKFKPPIAPLQFLWTPDSKQFVMTGSQAVLWEVETNKQLGTIAVSGVADWVRPGELLVFGRGDGMLEVRSLAGLPQARLQDRGRPLSGWAVLSPDGSELATRVGKDVLFFDAETGARRDAHSGTYHQESFIEWSPDGKRLAAWFDKELSVVDRATGEAAFKLTGHTAAIHTARWSPDGQRLVSASADKTVRIWDVSQGKEVAQQTFEGPAYDAVWSHSGQALAVALEKELVLLASDANSIQSRHAVPGGYGYRGGSHGLAWSPDDRKVTTGTYHMQAQLLDVASGTIDPLDSPQPAAPFIGSQAWSSDGHRLLAGTTYDDAQVIDAAAGTADRILPFANGQWHRDGRRLLSGLTNNHELYGYDADHKQRTGVLMPVLTNKPGQSLCISATGHVRGPANAIVYSVLLESGEQRTLTQARFEKAFGWKNDPDQASFLKPVNSDAPSSESPSTQDPFAPLAGSNESTLPIEPLGERGLGDRVLVARPAAIPNVSSWTIETAGHRGGVHTLAYSPSGKVIATAGDDSTIRFWDETCRPISVLVGAGGPVRTLAWSRGGQFLASAGDDRIVRLWDVPGQRRLREIALPVVPQLLTWSPDARRLAVAVAGGCWLIDAAAGRAEEFSLHVDGGVHWPAWSPDGKWLVVSFGSAGTVFDAATLVPIRDLDLPRDVNVLGVLEWSPQGDRLVGMYGSHHSRIGFWDLATGSFLGEGDSPAAYYPQRCRFSSDGTRVLTGSVGRHIYDVATRRVVTSVPWGTGAADISPDGQRVAGIRGNRLFLFDLISGAELASSSTQGVTGGGARMALSGDGKLLYTIDSDELLTFDNESGKLVERVPFENWQAMFSSPTPGMIAVKSEQRLAVYLTADKKMRELPGCKDFIYTVGWTQDGQRLATVARDKSLLIWDVVTGKVLSTFTLPEICDLNIRWQADNKELLARSSNGGSLRVNAETGAILERSLGIVPPLPPLVRPVGSLPDGDRRVVIEPGGVARVESGRLNRMLGAVVVGLTGRKHVVIGPSGHLQAAPSAESHLAYVTVADDGRQTTHPPSDFRAKFGWTNDPAQATFAANANEPPASPVRPAPERFAQDRLATDKVLALGGWVRVRIHGRTVNVQKASDIPAEPFEVRDVELASKPFTDADLEVLNGLRSLRSLNLGGCPKITDAVLTKIGPHPHLRVLALHSTPLTDAGVLLQGFPELDQLHLQALPVTDAIAPQLQSLKRLAWLELHSTKVTDKIAPTLASLQGLAYLGMHFVPLNDEAVERIATLPRLQNIAISAGTFTIRSGAALAKAKALRRVTLQGPSATDELIEGLADHPQLLAISLTGDQSTDRTATALARIPTLRELSLNGSKVTDDGIRSLVKLPLTHLELTVEGVSGLGFDAAADTNTIIHLRLTGGKLTPDGVRQLSRLKSLRSLVVDGRALTAEVMPELARIPNLSTLHIQPALGGRRLPFAGFSELNYILLYSALEMKPEDYAGMEAAPKLQQLHVYQADLTPEHWAIFRRLAPLTNLVLQDVKLKQVDLDPFKADRPNVKLELQGGQVQ